MLARIWIGRLIQEVTTRENTFFEPTLAAAGLIAVAATATCLAFAGLWRQREKSPGNTAAIIWAGNATTWAVALALPFITVTAIS
ncbi:MAG: hypothetical protein GY720_02865 [bacterium]|nr:hypothetical protein [bacterium]